MTLLLGIFGTAVGGILFGYFVSRLRAAGTHAELQGRLRTLEEKLAGREERLREERESLASKALENQALQVKIETLLSRSSELETLLSKERELSAQRLNDFEKAREELANAFKALASETLQASNTSFLELAQSTFAKFHEMAKGDLDKREVSIAGLVKPVQESLSKFDSKIQDLEKARVGAYESLSQQLRSMGETQGQLRSETQNLVRALANPRVRGRWGETQLRRVIELAGMLNYCDFQEQASSENEEGRQQRPDVIVKLPQGKTIIIDAKAPLSAYLEAMEATDESVKQERILHHARLVRGHIQDLSRKSYWAQFDENLEFVIMFLPGENFYQAALESDPELVEYAFRNNVIPATPASLISLMKAIAYGWRQEALASNSKKISELGKELYKRLITMSGHIASVGKNLNTAVDSYNKAVSSLETRVLSSARKFKDLAVDDPNMLLEENPTLEIQTRSLQSAELLDIDPSLDD
jgi:DNA recombination protein RmuC